MYKVKIGSFEQINKNDISEHCIIDEKNLKSLICIDNNDCMIDISSGNIYPMIKRKNGFIDENQEIILNKEYALYVQEYKNPNLKEYLLAFRAQLTTKNKQKTK